MGSPEKTPFPAESIGTLILNVNNEIPCKSSKFSLTTSFNSGKRLSRFSRLLQKSLAAGDVSEVLGQAPLRRKSGYRRKRKGIFPNRCALAQPDETTIQYYRIAVGNQPFDNSGLDSFGSAFLRWVPICSSPIFFALNPRGFCFNTFYFSENWESWPEYEGSLRLHEPRSKSSERGAMRGRFPQIFATIYLPSKER